MISTIPKNDFDLFLQEIHQCMGAMIFSDGTGQTLSSEHGFRSLHAMALNLRSEAKSLYFIGNGASASMCSHFAADLSKNAQIRTQLFNDAALLTSVGNDISFERIFAEPLSRMGQTEDMLCAISSSGRSPNILEAIKTARHNGMRVVTLSGMKADNPLRRLGDLNIYVPGSRYGLVETAHSAILHYWTDKLCDALA